MEWNSTLSLSDVASSISAFIAVFAIIPAAYQIRKVTHFQQATFFKDLYGIIYSDQVIQKAFYAIEYGDFQYGIEFHGSEEEARIDNLLSHFDLICGLYDDGLLTEKQMKFFNYRLIRVYRNTNITSYLSFLETWSKKNHGADIPYSSFQNYCKARLSAAK